jgi:hypothetical protein
MAGIQIVFAAKDPHRVAAFWQAAIGYAAEPPPEPFKTWDEFLEANHLPPDTGDSIDSAIDPAGIGPRILVERDEPGPRGAIHLDINASSRGIPLEEKRSLVDKAVERLEGLGATKGRVVDNGRDYFVEMTDPEGNWFCVQ